mmetsp:Transcript_32282/g.69685  ORF Transcript_32282/g.69685 Transcript_32282/m.69685 type:complete len:87 (+) Transcript_32282:657-917(+)
MLFRLEGRTLDLDVHIVVWKQENKKSYTNKDISRGAEDEPRKAYAQGPQIHFTTVIVLNRGYTLSTTTDHTHTSNYVQLDSQITTI